MGKAGTTFYSELRDFNAEIANGQLNWGRINSIVGQAVYDNLKDYGKRFTYTYPVGSIRVSDLEDISNKIEKIVQYSSKQRLLHDVSRAIASAYDVPSKDWVNEAAAVQHWVQNNIRYVFDRGEQFQMPGRIIYDWYAERSGGDCDCLAILYTSLMASMGWKNVYVVLVDPKGDGKIAHAMSAIQLPNPHIYPYFAKLINVELTPSANDADVRYFGWKPSQLTKYIPIRVRL